MSAYKVRKSLVTQIQILDEKCCRAIIIHIFVTGRIFEIGLKYLPGSPYESFILKRYIYQSLQLL
jgi:hypothetical protein